MKLSQLSLADYNKLDSIPVINQDLSASGFTPVANTYYRHTGATTDTFTQGVIYLYDTAYHKLGESGGGTTFNEYTYTTTAKPTVSQLTTIVNILNNAKRILNIDVNLSDGKYSFMTQRISLSGWLGYSIDAFSNTYNVHKVSINARMNDISGYKTEFTNSAFSTTEKNVQGFVINYINDTERA